jgi:hypothetical protein
VKRIASSQIGPIALPLGSSSSRLTASPPDFAQVKPHPQKKVATSSAIVALRCRARSGPSESIAASGRAL